MGPEVLAALLAAGTVATTGAFAAAVVLLIGRRHPAVAAALAPATVVVALALGVYMALQQMIIDARDATLVLIALAAAVPIALGLGLWLAHRTRSLIDRAARDAAAQDAAAELDQARRDLIAGVSHDLRTPLAGIRAMAESLEDGLAEDPADFLRRILRSVDRLDDMVEDLLSLSRLQGSQELVRTQRVDLRDLVSDTVASSAPVANRRGVEVGGAAENPVYVQADPALLTRALTNMTDNAIRLTPSGGRVTIAVQERDGTASLSVQDACGGIPDADVEHVFEAGWRGTTARGPDAGAGLGLAIVSEVAKGHRGTARVEQADGGCRFVIDLPVRDET